jgi:cytochrome c nitrite reductase small subunit
MRGFLVLSLLLGALGGLGAFTMLYAKAFSFLSSDPAVVCTNCHIMQPQFQAWQKASHHGVADCFDCHLPQAFFRKYTIKALNGIHDAIAFTAQNFAEPIRLKAPHNVRVLQENCLRCHEQLVHQMLGASGGSQQPQCVHCHVTVGHGETMGLGGPEDSS